MSWYQVSDLNISKGSVKGVRIRIVNFPWIRLSMDGAKALDVSFATFPAPSLPSTPTDF